jgi:hypothetical protein
VRLGEGLVGQCARDHQPITLDELPPDYLRIESGIGGAPPVRVSAVPLLSKDALLGIVELATLHRLDSREQALLDEVMPLAAMTLEVCSGTCARRSCSAAPGSRLASSRKRSGSSAACWSSLQTG